MRKPEQLTLHTLRFCPEDVREYVARLTRENADLRAKLAGTKMFPLQSSYSKTTPHPTMIPWAVADKAYAVYRGRYGSQQTLERLAERGGFSAGEMDDFYPGWREEVALVTELRAKLAAAVEKLPAPTTDHCQRCGGVIANPCSSQAIREWAKTLALSSQDSHTIDMLAGVERRIKKLEEKLAAAEKARDEQAEAVRVLAAEVHSWWVAMDVDPDDEEEGETFNVWHNPIAAAAVKEAAK